MSSEMSRHLRAKARAVLACALMTPNPAASLPLSPTGAPSWSMEAVRLNGDLDKWLADLERRLRGPTDLAPQADQDLVPDPFAEFIERLGALDSQLILLKELERERLAQRLKQLKRLLLKLKSIAAQEGKQAFAARMASLVRALSSEDDPERLKIFEDLVGRLAEASQLPPEELGQIFDQMRELFPGQEPALAEIDAAQGLVGLLPVFPGQRYPSASPFHGFLPGPTPAPEPGDESFPAAGSGVVHLLGTALNLAASALGGLLLDSDGKLSLQPLWRWIVDKGWPAVRPVLAALSGNLSPEQGRAFFAWDRPRRRKELSHNAEEALSEARLDLRQFTRLERADERLLAVRAAVLTAARVPLLASGPEDLRRQDEALRTRAPNLAIYFANRELYQIAMLRAVGRGWVPADTRFSPWELALDNENLSGAVVATVQDGEQSFTGLRREYTDSSSRFEGSSEAGELIVVTSPAEQREVRTRTEYDSQGRPSRVETRVINTRTGRKVREEVLLIAQSLTTDTRFGDNGQPVRIETVNTRLGRRTLEDRQQGLTMTSEQDGTTVVTPLRPNGQWREQRGVLDREGRFVVQRVVQQNGNIVHFTSPHVLRITDSRGRLLRYEFRVERFFDPRLRGSARETLAWTVAREIVTALGLNDLDEQRSRPLHNFLFDIEPRSETYSGVTLTANADGHFTIFYAYPSGGGILHQAKFENATPYGGSSRLALIVFKYASVDRQGRATGDGARWREYWANGGYTQWRISHQTVERNWFESIFCRIENRTNYYLDDYSWEGNAATGYWRCRGSELKHSAPSYVDYSSILGIVGHGIYEAPVIGHILQAGEWVGNTTYTGIVGGLQYNVALITGDDVYNLYAGGSFANNQAMARGISGVYDGMDPEEFLRRLSPGARRILEGRATERRQRYLATRPDIQNQARTATLSRPFTNQELFDALRDYGATQGGRVILEDVAAHEQGAARAFWTAAGFGTRFIENAGQASFNPVVWATVGLGSGVQALRGLSAAATGMRLSSVAAVGAFRAAQLTNVMLSGTLYGTMFVGALDNIGQAVQAASSGNTQDAVLRAADATTDIFFLSLLARGRRNARASERANTRIQARETALTEQVRLAQEGLRGEGGEGPSGPPEPPPNPPPPRPRGPRGGARVLGGDGASLMDGAGPRMRSRAAAEPVSDGPPSGGGRLRGRGGVVLEEAPRVRLRGQGGVELMDVADTAPRARARRAGGAETSDGPAVATLTEPIVRPRVRGGIEVAAEPAAEVAAQPRVRVRPRGGVGELLDLASRPWQSLVDALELPATEPTVRTRGSAGTEVAAEPTARTRSGGVEPAAEAAAQPRARGRPRSGVGELLDLASRPWQSLVDALELPATEPTVRTRGSAGTEVAAEPTARTRSGGVEPAAEVAAQPRVRGRPRSGVGELLDLASRPWQSLVAALELPGTEPTVRSSGVEPTVEVAAQPRARGRPRSGGGELLDLASRPWQSLVAALELPGTEPAVRSSGVEPTVEVAAQPRARLPRSGVGELLDLASRPWQSLVAALELPGTEPTVRPRGAGGAAMPESTMIAGRDRHPSSELIPELPIIPRTPVQPSPTPIVVASLPIPRPHTIPEQEVSPQLETSPRLSGGSGGKIVVGAPPGGGGETPEERQRRGLLAVPPRNPDQTPNPIITAERGPSPFGDPLVPPQPQNEQPPQRSEQTPPTSSPPAPGRNSPPTLPVPPSPSIPSKSSPPATPGGLSALPLPGSGGGSPGLGSPVPSGAGLPSTSTGGGSGGGDGSGGGGSGGGATGASPSGVGAPPTQTQTAPVVGAPTSHSAQPVSKPASPTVATTDQPLTTGSGSSGKPAANSPSGSPSYQAVSQPQSESPAGRSAATPGLNNGSDGGNPGGYAVNPFKPMRFGRAPTREEKVRKPARENAPENRTVLPKVGQEPSGCGLEGNCMSSPRSTFLYYDQDEKPAVSNWLFWLILLAALVSACYLQHKKPELLYVLGLKSQRP